MKKSIIFLLTSFVFFSCSNDDDNSETSNPMNQEGTNVYVGGHDRISDVKVAAIWKNGERTILGDGVKDSDIQSIFTTANDVYAVGYQKNSDHMNVATIWKNGIAADLNDGTKNAQAYSVFISNDDVYVVGNIEKGK